LDGLEDLDVGEKVENGMDAENTEGGQDRDTEEANADLPEEPLEGKKKRLGAVTLSPDEFDFD
jgi:hypothetical protein